MDSERRLIAHSCAISGSIYYSVTTGVGKARAPPIARIAVGKDPRGLIGRGERIRTSDILLPKLRRASSRRCEPFATVGDDYRLESGESSYPSR
jgi:hypothetical protein